MSFNFEGMNKLILNFGRTNSFFSLLCFGYIFDFFWGGGVEVEGGEFWYSFNFLISW